MRSPCSRGAAVRSWSRGSRSARAVTVGVSGSKMAQLTRSSPYLDRSLIPFHRRTPSAVVLSKMCREISYVSARGRVSRMAAASSSATPWCTTRPDPPSHVAARRGSRGAQVRRSCRLRRRPDAAPVDPFGRHRRLPKAPTVGASDLDPGGNAGDDSPPSAGERIGRGSPGRCDSLAASLIRSHPQTRSFAASSRPRLHRTTSIGTSKRRGSHPSRARRPPVRR